MNGEPLLATKRKHSPLARSMFDSFGTIEGCVKLRAYSPFAMQTYNHAVKNQESGVVFQPLIFIWFF